MTRFRFRLRTLFIGTAVIAVLLFVAKNLTIELTWWPANRDVPDCSLLLQWHRCKVVDLAFGRDPDDKAYFQCEFFKMQQPQTVVLSWTDSSGMHHVLQPTSGPRPSAPPSEE